MRPTIIQQLDKHAELYLGCLFARFLQTGDMNGSQTIWTWAELQRSTRTIAAHISEIAAPGERALLICHEGLEFIASFLGCLRARIIAVPVAPPLPTWRERHLETVKAIAEDATPSLVITTSDLVKTFATVDSPISRLSTIPWLAVDHLKERSFDSDPQIDPNRIAFLQYTSGSTGTPKGVTIRHSNIMANLAVIQTAF
jgi:acyl-CoA synthetase (AMP-forming)/AMP-acid ligase II